ncbi:MAG: DNA gyrase subunit A [bacterium]
MNFINNYIKQPITKTLEINYMPYAMSVIISRAIPEIDGFKPSHRKLLYTMYKMGLLSKDRTKSTNVVGQTMKLNPHGDSAIYETLVRLTRGNESLLTPFIDSKGNFGKHFSKDMSFAASRYTEVKLAPICNEIFKNIEKNTVDFVDNYDGKEQEPVLFPTTFPNILVTNNQGIAVSMASSICSFNLKEVCTTTIKFIKDPNINIIKYLKAPDFPTGGELVYNQKDLETIYETGRGSFKLRGKYLYDKKNSLIEIYEIPYTTTIEAIIDKIIFLVKSNKIKEINDVRNETDKNGLKITIDIKRNADPELLMRKLFSMTPLMDTFSCNFNILINGVPQTLGIRPILQNWLDFRIECVKRQTAFDLNKKKERHHLLSGLSKILNNIDKAISIIRDTEKDSLVIPNLEQEFGLDSKQAEYICDIRLRNLNKEYLTSKTLELSTLNQEILDLTKIYKNPELIKDIICDELSNISKSYNSKRKTTILQEEIPTLLREDFIDDYSVMLFLTNENYFKKVSLSSLRSSGEHKLKESDFILFQKETTNKCEILFFSDKQNVYKLKLHEIPDTKVSSIGHYLNNILNLKDDEKILAFATTSSYNGFILFAFDNGKVTKVSLSLYKSNRKKLVSAFSNKSTLSSLLVLERDSNIFVNYNDKAILLNTSLIEEQSTKSSQGVQILALPKTKAKKSVNMHLEVVTTELSSQKQLEKYKVNTIPAKGILYKN